MNSYDLELAFFRRLIALTYGVMRDVRPDEVFDPGTNAPAVPFRRGFVLLNDPETVAFGNGVFSRIGGIYQIDLWVPRLNDGQSQGGFKLLKTLTDEHIAQFWPVEARGLTVTENDTSAHIVRRPGSRFLGREGAFIREMIEVDFYVDVDSAAPVVTNPEPAVDYLSVGGDLMVTNGNPITV